MPKLTLSNLANLNNQTTAVNTINANSDLIETAIENTLSRDGTVPNTMGADLDLNGYDLLNVGNLVIDGEIITGDTVSEHVEFIETTVPSSPVTNRSRMYAVDNAGTTTLQVKDSAGVTSDISHFKQTGTGATVRTQSSKLSEVLSVLDFGADPTGVADSAAAIQAAIDAAAAISGARGTVHIPSSGLGATYKIASALTWKANVNILCDPGTRIFASAAMNAMLQTGTGSSNRLRNVWLHGGRWDGAFLARRGLWIKEGNGVHLQNFLIRQIGTFVDGVTETESSYIRIGDPGQFTSCYEIMIDDFFLARADDAGSPTFAPANNYGIFSTDGASDCHVSNGNISGVKFGMADEMAHWKINFVHVWNYQPGHGALVNGFYDNIGGVIYTGCQVDCATYEIPWRVDGTFHPNQIMGCQVNCSLDTASSSDNVGTAISVGTGAQLAAIGNTISCDVTKRFATDFSGSLALVTIHGHQNKNVVSPVGNSGVTTPDGRIVSRHSTALVGPTGVTSKLQALGADANAATLVARFSADSGPPRISGAKSRHATVGSHTIVQSGDTLLEIVGMGSNGTDFQNAALMRVLVDGTPGAATDMPGAWVWYTSADGSATPVEGWRVGANGRVTAAQPLGGLGYGTGAGGTVTQITSKSTAVVLNKVCGQITTHNATLNAGVEVGFSVTNSAVAATDVVVLSIASGGSFDSYHLSVDSVTAGFFRISISNVSASNLGEALVINFAVIKAVTS